MSQVATPELQQWIVEQARAGCKPEAVLSAMTQAGWQEDVAIAAMEAAMGTHVALEEVFDGLEGFDQCGGHKPGLLWGRHGQESSLGRVLWAGLTLPAQRYVPGCQGDPSD